MNLNSRLLLMMQNKAAKFFVDECNIYSLSDARGESGESLDLLELSASGVNCRLISLASSGDVGEFADKTVMDEMYTITLPIGTVIDVYYVIEMVTTGNRYEVMSIRDHLSDSAYFDAEIKRMRD